MFVLKGSGNLSLREHCDERAKSLMSDRSDIDAVVADISSLAQTSRSRFMPSKDRRPRKTSANRLYDGYGISAAEILTNGMTSGLSSPTRPWFKTKVADPDLMKFHAVKSWLAAVDRVLMDFLNSTNFYAASKSGYSELGLFGTEACFMAEHWRRGMVCHPLTFGEYWIACGDSLEPDTLLRQVPMTCRQMVEQFVVSQYDRNELDWSKVTRPVQEAWDKSRYEQSFDVMHLVEPNPVWDPVRLDAAGMPIRSIYWEPRNDAQRVILEAGGQEEQPMWAARWDIKSSATWGVGPGWSALPDLRGLQAQAKRKGDATDYAIKPPMIAPASLKLRMAPGSVTHGSTTDKDAVRPIWQVDYQAIEAVGKDVLRCYEAIDRHFYVRLFMAITQMDGVQPRNEEEIFARNEEKLTQLGSVIDRVNNEKLGVVIDRAFGICNRRGLIPPAPEELENMELSVEYVSILAQAQKAVGLSVVERSLGFVGNIAKSFPSVLDNIDSDKVTVNYLERAGFPMEGIRDPKERDRMRAAAARQAAAQQARETAPAFKQGAEGAELMSRTDVRGRPLLDAVLGGAGG